MSIRVENWLEDVPYVSGAAWIKAPDLQRQYEMWKVEGKEIHNAEETLLSMVATETEAGTLDKVIVGLSAVGGKKSVTPLVKVLDTGPIDVRYRAGWALAMIGDRSAIGPLCDVLEGGDELARSNACLALGALGGARAELCLKKALADESEMVRSFAKTGLNMLRQAQSPSLPAAPERRENEH